MSVPVASTQQLGAFQFPSLSVPKHGAPSWAAAAAVSSASYLEGAHQGFVHAHHAARVVKLAAVVRSREQRHQLPLGKKLVAVFYHLGAQTQGFISAPVEESMQ